MASSKIFQLFVAFCLVGVVFLATAVAAQSAAVDARQEKRLLDCKLESKNLDECDPVGYGIRVAVFSAPGLVIALFLLISCPLYCCCKYCCNCCGGRRQSPNFCCPNKELPARYSVGDIVRPKVFALLLILITVAGLLWGIVGATTLTEGVTDFVEQIRKVPDIITNEIDAIDKALTIERFTPEKGVFVVKLMDETAKDLKNESLQLRDKLKKQVDGSLGDFQSKVDTFKQGLFASFGVPAGFILLGFFAALFNIRRYCPMCIVWLLFLFGFILWFAHVVFCIFSMVVGDVCAEVHGLANKQMNLVSVLSSCNDSQFSSFRTTFKEVEVTESAKVCNLMKGLCFDPLLSDFQNILDKKVYDCGAGVVCTAMTFSNLLDLLTGVMKIHPRIANSAPAQAEGQTCISPKNFNDCYVSTCAEDCIKNGRLSDIGNKSKEIFFNFRAARTVANTIDTLGARFSTCDSIMSIIATPFSPPCTKVVDGLVMERQATGLLGLCIIGGIFIFAWGSKRFIPLSQAEMAQMEDFPRDENGPPQQGKVAPETIEA